MSDFIYPVHDAQCSRHRYEERLQQKATVLWLTGLSGAGKTTLAYAAAHALLSKNFIVKVLDGDTLRTGLCNNLDFSIEGRTENIRRIAEVARQFLDIGIITIVSVISPLEAMRAQARHIIGNNDFHEIYIDADLQTCQTRDVKGLYAKASQGAIPNFTGTQQVYEPPQHPAVHINTAQCSIADATEQLVNYYLNKLAL